MRDRIGEEYDAVICSVTSFGFFAKTDNLCEGLVSIDSLGGGFSYDKDNYTLARGKTVYRLGQSVKIKVEDADITTRRVDFSLVGAEKVAHPRRVFKDNDIRNDYPRRKKPSLRSSSQGRHHKRRR